MKNKSIMLLMLIIVASCKTHTKKDNARQSTEEKQWGYQGETGPEHWVEIEKNSACNGQFQSPINILSINARIDNKLKPLDIHYSPNTKIYNVVNNGHSIQYNFKEGDFINYKNKKFMLKQIHFHEPAEHTIDGVRYPMVIHMVHSNKEGAYLVLAVMVKEGEMSEPFKFLKNYLPIHTGGAKIVNASFNLNLNLPPNRAYFNYTGSLTTPPCTEGVEWVVFKEPISIAVEQVKRIQKLMPLNNYRNEQSLHGRIVKKTK